jgi:hypothetical protein
MSCIDLYGVQAYLDVHQNSLWLNMVASSIVYRTGYVKAA